jgi:hypothetical protein
MWELGVMSSSWYRGVGSGWAWWAHAHPDFGKIEGGRRPAAAHRINTCLTRFSDFATPLWCLSQPNASFSNLRSAVTAVYA